MRRLLVALLVALPLGGPAPAGAHGPTVEISAEGVSPRELVIARGQTVHFHNGDARPHVVVGEDDAFRSPEMAAHGGWHLRFPFPGRFPYALEARPEQRGVIRVEEGKP